MAEDHGDKSQQPTPRRRQVARESGQVAQSADVNSAAMLLAGLAALIVCGGALVHFLAGMLVGSLSGGAWLDQLASSATDEGALILRWNTLAIALAKVLLPVLGLVALASIALGMLQTGLSWMPSKLIPDFSRVSPLAGWRRTASTINAVRCGFGVFKILVIGAVAAANLYARREPLMSASALDLPQLATFAWELCLGTCLRIGAALAVLAVIDYGYQRWRFERDLRMTPQEVREEMRSVQGDPALVARRRAVGLQLAQQRALGDVSQADLVVESANIAVALVYDADSMTAPKIVARGAGASAGPIRDLAAKNDVPIIRQAALAEALYREAALHAPIPSARFSAVADLLAQAIRSKRKPAAA